MQVQIKFTASGSSSLTGNFAPGDTFRCSEAHAAHFVNEARCAVYMDAKPSDPPAEEPPAHEPPKKRGKRNT